MKYDIDTQKIIKIYFELVFHFSFFSIKACSYMGSLEPHLPVKLIVAFRCNHRQSSWFSEAPLIDKSSHASFLPPNSHSSNQFYKLNDSNKCPIKNS